MVFILVDHITPRLQYTFKFIFEVRNVSYRLVTDLDQWNSHQGVKIDYTQKNDNSVSDLLYSDTIQPSIDYSTLDKCLLVNGIVDFPASIFFILTRMEEYSCERRDKHGRFPFSESVLSKYDLIEQAVCDRWAVKFLKDNRIEFESPSVGFIPSFDIDNTYAYKLKGGMRKWLSISRDLLNQDAQRLKERRSVMRGAKDPYDTFDKIRAIGQKFPETLIFWLTESNGAKDRNVSLNSREHIDLIVDLSMSLDVNLHPSYDSFNNSTKIKKELNNLATITGEGIFSSRQHFLRFSLPQSYQSLIDAGISDDYSMGFAEHVGFRAGTAHAHNWFDLAKNEETSFTIHPFVYMDGSLNEYQQLSIDESREVIAKLYNEVTEYGGDFIFIWHNETIGDYGKWAGWSEVLNYTIELHE